MAINRKTHAFHAGAELTVGMFLALLCGLLTSAVLMLMFEYEARYKSFGMAGREGHYRPRVVKETVFF